MERGSDVVQRERAHSSASRGPWSIHGNVESNLCLTHFTIWRLRGVSGARNFYIKEWLSHVRQKETSVRRECELLSPSLFPIGILMRIVTMYSFFSVFAAMTVVVMSRSIPSKLSVSVYL